MAHDNKIEYLSLHDYKNTSHRFSEDKYLEQLDYYKKTIVHEYVHFITGQYCIKNNLEYPAKFLSEGIATYLSKQKEGLKLEFNYTIEAILESKTSYYAWYMLIKYIIEKYGKEYYLKLLTNSKLANEEAPRLFEEAKEYYKS